MRGISDVISLVFGLIADLFRREGPLRRAPGELIARLRRERAAGLGDARGGIGSERFTNALVLVSSSPVVALSWAGRGARRTRCATARAVRNGIDGAARAGRRGVEGSRPQANALSDAIARTVAWLARSVLSMPGGPVPVTAVAVVVLGLAGFAWMQPMDSDRVQMRPFVVEYAFDYRAQLPQNMVYEDRDLRFGDPVFLSEIGRAHV
jgi:hypothetical protein